MSKRDYYEVLGVNKSSSKDEIKKAYRKIALKNHPDRNPDNQEAEAKFKEASEAADVLLDPKKKQQYDQFGHSGMNGQGFGGFNSDNFQDFGDIFGDIFGDFFGGGGSGRRRGGRNSNARHGNDLQTTMHVTFEEAAFGVEKKLQLHKDITCSSCTGTGASKGSSPVTCDTCNGHGEVRRQQGFFTIQTSCPKCNGAGQMIKNPCKPCHGKGTSKKNVELMVKIPAGIDQGQRLKLTGEGDKGSQGGIPGDLYVLIDIEEHEFFEREDFDVYCVVPISFSQAALGASVEVPTLSGKVEVRIPSGAQSGRKMRLKGKGIPRLGSYGEGDQIIEVHVETPSELTQEQRELFVKLSDLEHKQCNPMSKGFFERVKDIFQ
jgi:molecular chaperone DnaJ